MPANNFKKTAIGIGVVVIVVLLGWWLLSVSKKGGVSPSAYPGGPGAGGPGVGQPAGSQTRTEAPSNVVVPGATSTNVPANVAKPSLVTKAAPNSAASFRKFSISVSGGQFVPSNVIANVGDTVHLDITAADGNYDFTQPDYGFNVPLPKGQAKVVEFQTTAEGKFIFYCKSCGGPKSGPVGYLIVVSSK